MDQFLTCGICTEQYSSTRVPLVLQCGHTFCSICLNRIKSSQLTLKCPIDRLPETRSQTEIRPNITLIQLIDYHSNASDTKCSLHPSKKSKFLCFDCSSNYCSRCIHLHIFHKWIEFSNTEKKIEYLHSRKNFLEDVKKNFEHNFEAWVRIDKEINEQKRKMVEDVKTRYKQQIEALTMEKEFLLGRIEEATKKSKETVESRLKVTQDCLRKISDLLKVQIKAAHEVLLYENDCCKIRSIQLWLDSPESKPSGLFF